MSIKGLKTTDSGTLQLLMHFECSEGERRCHFLLLRANEKQMQDAGEVHELNAEPKGELIGFCQDGIGRLWPGWGELAVIFDAVTKQGL